MKITHHQSSLFILTDDTLQTPLVKTPIYVYLYVYIYVYIAGPGYKTGVTVRESEVFKVCNIH